MRISKSRFFASLLLVTLTFLFFQLVFVNYIKSLGNTNLNAFDGRPVNPRFGNVLASNLTSTKPADTVLDVPSLAEAQNGSKYSVQIQIPMLNGQPDLFYLLPFQHKKNMISLKTVMIEDAQRDLEHGIDEVKLLRGINQLKFELYLPGSDGMFKCLNSNVSRRDTLDLFEANRTSILSSIVFKQKIAYSKLNDDFCDCVDATDEPGTSACLFST